MKTRQVVIVLGSESDLALFKESAVQEILDKTKISYEVSIISADRHHKKLRSYCLRKLKEGTSVFIGAAGMLPVLPGSIASIIEFKRPVFCIPLDKDTAKAMALKPSGAPVPVAGIGKAGLDNAALSACQILSLKDEKTYMVFQETLMAIRKKKPAKVGIIKSK